MNGYLIAAVWLAVIAALIAIVGAWDHRPRTESRSERNHRIDAEARTACEPPVIWSGGNTLPETSEAKYHGSGRWGR